MQFRLPGAVPADGIDVDARADHVVREDRRVLLVRGCRRDDVGTFDRFLGRSAEGDGEAEIPKVFLATPHRVGIDVEEAQAADPEERPEGPCLELALCAGADQRHGPRVFGCQIASGNRRHRRRPERRQDGHFRKQQRIACLDIGEHAERRHGLASGARVLRVSVDILKTVEPFIGGRHQFDHPFCGMRGDTRGLVEMRPPPEILLNVAGQFDQEVVDACLKHEIHHVLDADERH